MGTSKTIKAIQNDIAGNGESRVPFAAIERILRRPCIDDDIFEAQVAKMVDSANWLERYEIAWIDGIVTLYGPWKEPDN